jgi:prefoldin alpha subunit
MGKQVSKTKKVSQEEMQKRLQEKYMEYQMIEEQTKKVQEQLDTFDKQIEELNTIQNAVEDLEKTRKGTEIFVPVSSGIFIKAEIKKTTELLVNVGDNVVVEKSIKDAIELIKKQQTDIQDYKSKVTENASMLMIHSKKIEQEVLEMAQAVESE